VSVEYKGFPNQNTITMSSTVAKVNHVTPASGSSKDTIVITKDEYISSLRKQRLVLRKNNDELEKELSECQEMKREMKSLMVHFKKRAYAYQEKLIKIGEEVKSMADTTMELGTIVDEEGSHFEKEEHYREGMDKLMGLFNKLKAMERSCPTCHLDFCEGI